MPDLASLLESVDQDHSVDLGELVPRAAPAVPAASENLAPVSTPTPPVADRPEAAPRSARRKLPDLSLLYSEGAPPDSTSAPRAEQKPDLDESAAANRLVIDPDLEEYIYPDLWRKLNGLSPSRGILINTLDQVRSTFNLLSAFLPQHLVQEKMRKAVPGLVSGQVLQGTLLFSDVSGFTALSERLQGLGPKGVEILTEMMNRYFSQMVEILARSGGTLLKFAGDAMLVYFPQQEQNEQVNWAVRAGQRMLNAMQAFSALEAPGGKVALKMKIGIGSGEFLAASVGSAQRMEYIVLGQAVAETMIAESLTTAAGQIVVNASTRPTLDPAFPVVEQKNGYFRINRGGDETVDEFEIKAETRRARGALPWDASPHAILAQAEVTLRQIKAILPYLSPEVVDHVVIHGQRTLFASQYRPTTTVFCNFWGFESLLGEWGGEGASRVTGLLNAYFSAMSEVVTRFGGIISRIDPYSKGTKILILFGAPVAHEDDPQRAVSAALAMNAELETINETWRRKLGRHLPAGFTGPLIQHRMGITTGTSFAGQVGSPTRREYTVMGDEVNLAARLMGAADAGQILLSSNADLQSQVGAYFYLTERAPLRVKGKSKPISVAQVQGLRDDRLVRRARERGALIGRRAELSKAEALLRQTRDAGGAILILEGPAGIGKSHLADAVIRRAEDLHLRVLSHQCRSYSAATPYGCWSLLLRQLAGITSTDYRSEVHHQKLRQLIDACQLPQALAQPLAMLMGLKPMLPEAEEPVGGNRAEVVSLGDETAALARQVRQGMKKPQRSRLDLWDQLDGSPTSETGQVWQPITTQLAGSEREKVYGAVRKLLGALADPEGENSPLGVIFFEDAHWMDAASQDLLQWIGGGLEDLPVLVVLARRKGEERLSSPRRAQTITLGPLAEDETGALVASLLTADLAQVIHEQSQGNPLFIEEITRWYKRSHQISPEELRNVLQTSNFLQKLILSHLESLPDELQEIAMVAAVIGNEFRTGEVQALLPGGMDAVTLSNHLRTLARSNLIGLVEVGADARYTFQQSLVRDILYNSLPFEKRRELHGKLGDYLNRPLTGRRELQAQLAAALEAASTDPIQIAETIAGHFALAERWLDAARQFWLAGDHARRQNDAARASASFERALAALEKLPVETLDGDARQLKAQISMAQGDLALLADAYLNALSAYEAARANLDDNRPALILRLALVLPTQRKPEEAESLLRSLFDQPDFLPGPEFLAIQAWLARRANQADAVQWVEACERRLAESGGGGDGIRALLADLSANWSGALEGYRKAACPAGAAMMAVLLGQQAAEQGNPDQALSQYRLADEIAGQAGVSACVALACYRQAELHWRAGRPEDARAGLERSQAALEKAPAQVAADGFAAVRQAQKAVNTNSATKWRSWPIQDMIDQYTIRLLFGLAEIPGGRTR